MMQEKVDVRMDALRDEIIDLYRKHVPHVFDEVSAGRLPAPTQSLVFAMVADLAHRAGPDAYVTAHLIVALLNAGATVEQMINWTGAPSLLPTVQFGKHRGKKWEQVPYDYLTWIAGQANIDPDVKHTAKHHINLRRGRAH